MTMSPLLDGLTFAECPRWHAGRLWFSDMFAHRVLAVDGDGTAECVVQLDDEDVPAGLGFLPDGRLLIANMARPVILRLDEDGALAVHADLADLAVGPLNDMVVDRHGRAYVGAFGTDEVTAPRPLAGSGSIIRVDPDGTARIVADHMDAPNGPAISADGSLYVVASFQAQELTGFDITPDGALTGRRVWADLRPASADGITMDERGGVWTCAPMERELRRIVEGGTVTDVVPVRDKMPIAPCLGGSDGRTLFVCSLTSDPATVGTASSTSVIETVRVRIPAGR